MKPSRAVRLAMENGEMLVAIGAQDALSATLVERAGFNAVYVGSYATEATFLGQPDLGLMSKSERVLLCHHITKAVSVPVIADMEEGYGNAISVANSIRDFERAGVAGVHIDDQQLPAKCPFLPVPPNQLISVDEMCGKIRAACDARSDPDLLLIARTDVVATTTREEFRRSGRIEEVVARSRRYAEAGADAIFVMAFSEEELAYYRQAIKVPLVGIFATVEPLPLAMFRRQQYEIVIGSPCTLYMSIKGIVDGLKRLKETEDWNAIQDHMVGDEEFFDIVGLKKYLDPYTRYSVP